jgi:hypothetical protein
MKISENAIVFAVVGTLLWCLMRIAGPQVSAKPTSQAPLSADAGASDQ